MTGSSKLTRAVDIGADPATVWRLLTTEAGLLEWIGVEAVADAVPGGELSWVHENGATMVGRFVDVEPERRVVFTYGWKDALLGMPPGSTQVEIVLHPIPAGTRLELTHSGLPPEVAADHDLGWSHFLGQLAICGN